MIGITTWMLLNYMYVCLEIISDKGEAVENKDEIIAYLEEVIIGLKERIKVLESPPAPALRRTQANSYYNISFSDIATNGSGATGGNGSGT